MNIQSSFTVYTAALHALILNPLLLAYFWLGLSWIDSIDSISANKRFSSSKTSSRKPYSNSKQQEKQKHSAENTINFSCASGQWCWLPFAAMIPVLRHEQVQDLGRYATAPPGNLALRRHHPKGNKYDIPRSPTKHCTSGGRGSASFPSPFPHPPWTVLANHLCGSA